MVLSLRTLSSHPGTLVKIASLATVESIALAPSGGSGYRLSEVIEAAPR